MTSPDRRPLPRSTVVVVASPTGAAGADITARGYTTSSVPKRESADAMSSTNPRARTSCAGSPDRFSNGASAMRAAMAAIRPLSAATEDAGSPPLVSSAAAGGDRHAHPPKRCDDVFHYPLIVAAHG